MKCYKCGANIPDGNAFCGNCGAPAPVVPAPVEDNNKPEPKRNPFFKAPGKNAKNFAAVATALMVFPASLCGVIDLIFHRNDGWSLYVIGALMVAWMVLVYPVLNITPAPVTALLSFFSVVTYGLFIAGRVGFFERLYKVGLPLMVLLAIFVAVDSALVGSGKLKGLRAVTVVSLEAAIYMIALEAAIDLNVTGAINLRWSLIIACFLVSVIALAEAVSYVIKNNKK